jgi:nucleotide-binding universal stress UspA family protein
MVKHVLIATDGSELADKALIYGLELARALHAKATIVTVTEPWVDLAPPEVSIVFPIEEYEKGAAQMAQHILSKAVQRAVEEGVSCEVLHVKDQYPAEGIIETARECGCDLIVMASHGRRGLSRMMLGSQANKVVAQSSVPVLIWRA